MPEIRVHGRGGKGKGSGPGGQAPGGLGTNIPKGPRSTILPDIPVEVSDNPQRESDYTRAQAQANQQNPYDDDYTKALRQRTAQVNAQTAGVLRKHRQEAAMWQAHDQQEVKDQRTLDQVTKDEIQEREAQLADEKKENARRDRIKKKDEQDQDRLDRSNQVLHNRRLNQERGLQNQFRNLGNQANWHLTPTGFRSLSQSLENFDEKVGNFKSTHHQMPNYGGSTADIRAGMGTLEGSYHVANVLRMGSAGQRFAFEGNYTELVRIERELKRIENLTDKKLRFDQSPAAQANLERQKNALLHVRTQIRTGLEGHGRLYNAVGRGYGRIMNTFRDPVMRTVMDAVTATVGAPYAANRMVEGAIGMQRRYINWDLAAQALARGGAGQMSALREIRGSGIERTLLNMDKSGYVPGNGMSAYAARFGLNPEDAMNQVLNQYGVPVRSERQAARIAGSVRMGYLAPGVQLPENKIFSMLGGATSLGVVNPNEAGRDAYLRQLQKTMAVATKEGVNQSRMAEGWQSLVQTAARTGLTTDLGGMSKFFRSLAASGAPGAREGQLQASLFAGTQQAIQGIGVTGDIPMDVAVMSAFPQGLPNSEAELSKAFGIKFDHKNRAQMNALKNYMEAKGPFKLNALQPLLAGESPDKLYKFLTKNPMIRHMPPGMRQAVLANLMHTNQVGLNALEAAPSGAGAAAMSQVAPYIPEKLFNNIAQSSTSKVAAPELASLVMTESGGHVNSISSKGAIGLTQLMPGTIDQYNKENGTHFSVTDVKRDPSLNMKIGSWYFGKMMDLAHGNSVLAYGMYNWGPGHENDIIAGNNVPPETQQGMARFARFETQYSGSNEALNQLTKLGVGASAGLEGSRYINQMSDTVIAAFKGAASAVEGLATAAEHASTALSNMFNHGTQSIGHALSSNPAGAPSHLMNAYTQQDMGGLYSRAPVK